MISAITTILIAASTLLSSGSTDSKATAPTSGQIITSDVIGM